MSQAQLNARIPAIGWVFVVMALILRGHAWHIIPTTAAAFAVWCLLNTFNTNESSEELGFDGVFFWIFVGVTIFSELIVLLFGG